MNDNQDHQTGQINSSSVVDTLSTPVDIKTTSSPVPASSSVLSTTQPQPTSPTQVSADAVSTSLDTTHTRAKRIGIILVVLFITGLCTFTAVFAFNPALRATVLELLPMNISEPVAQMFMSKEEKQALISKQEADALFATALAKSIQKNYIKASVIIPQEQGTSPDTIYASSTNVLERDFDKKLTRLEALSTVVQKVEGTTTLTTTLAVESIFDLNGSYLRTKIDFSSNDKEALKYILMFSGLSTGKGFTKWIYTSKEKSLNDDIFKLGTSSQMLQNPDVLGLLKIPPDNFVIGTTTKEAQDGKNFTRFSVYLKDGVITEYVVASSTFLRSASSTFDLLIDNDSQTVHSIVIPYGSSTATLIMTPFTVGSTIQVPEKYITQEQLEAYVSEKSLPGFISASSTRNIGGNSSLGTSPEVRYKKILIVPFGDVPTSDITLITSSLSSMFNNVSVEVAPLISLTDDMESGLSSPKQKQYLFETLIKKMQEIYKNDAQIIVGVLAEDGSTSMLNFAFSSVSSNFLYDVPPAGVFSTYRIKSKSDKKLNQLRYQKILQRVIGLAAGLRPASTLSCPMAQTISVSALDEKGTKWCGDDEVLLQKAGLIK